VWTALLEWDLFNADFLLQPFGDNLPYKLMVSSLSLLLVFRTNSSYDKFWEACKIFGKIANSGRTLTRMGMSTLKDDRDKELMAQYNALFPFLLKQHLQSKVDIDELKAIFKDDLLLSEEELEDLANRANPPLISTERMGELVAKSFEGRTDMLAYTYRKKMEEQVTLLIDYLGMCERIKLTPIPEGYTKHLIRFSTLYLGAWVFSLAPVAHWYTPLWMFIVTWSFISLEEIGFFIEDPFTLEDPMRMGKMCENIEVSIKNLFYGASYETGPMKAYGEDSKDAFSTRLVSKASATEATATQDEAGGVMAFLGFPPIKVNEAAAPAQPAAKPVATAVKAAVMAAPAPVAKPAPEVVAEKEVKPVVAKTPEPVVEKPAPVGDEKTESAVEKPAPVRTELDAKNMQLDHLTKEKQEQLEVVNQLREEIAALKEETGSVPEEKTDPVVADVEEDKPEATIIEESKPFQFGNSWSTFWW